MTRSINALVCNGITKIIAMFCDHNFLFQDDVDS